MGGCSSTESALVNNSTTITTTDTSNAPTRVSNIEGIETLRKFFDEIDNMDSTEATNEFLLKNIEKYARFMLLLKKEDYTEDVTAVLTNILAQLAFLTSENFEFNKIVNFGLFEKLKHILDHYSSLIGERDENDLSKGLLWIFKTHLFTLLGNLSRDSELISKENIKLGFIEKALEFLTTSDFFNKKNLISKELFDLCNTLISFICKNSNWASNAEKFHEFKAIEKLLQFTKQLDNAIERNLNDQSTEMKILKVNIVLALYNLLDEDDLSVNKTANDIIQTLYFLLDDTIEHFSTNESSYCDTKFYFIYGKYRERYFLASSAIYILNKISTNDSIKQLIFDTNLISLLIVIFEDGNQFEQELAASLMTSLCFCESVRKYISNNKQIFNAINLKSLNTDSKEIQKLCQQMMYMIDKKLEPRLKIYQAEHNPISLSMEDKSLIQIMISYDVTDEIKCKILNNELKKQQYKTWIDTDNQDANLINGMADAIENSDLIIVCYSLSYKESSICRYEAEYARKLGKPIIFLKTQQGFNPSGWLSSIIDRSSDVIDFMKTDKNSLKEALSLIDKKIEENVTNEKNDNSRVVKWSEKDVETWLRDDVDAIFVRVFKAYNGLALKTLWEMKWKNSTRFYSTIDDEIKASGLVISLERKLKFYKCLDNLFK